MWWPGAPDWLALTLTFAVFTVFGMVRRQTKSAEEAAQHPIRRLLLELIRRRPGLNESDMARLAGHKRGTTQYHLLVLARVGAVAVADMSDGRRYFAPDVDPDQIARLALLMRGRIHEVARAIIKNPGITQAELTQLLPMSRRVFREYADMLDEQHLIKETRDEGTPCYYPTPDLVRLTATVQPPAGQSQTTPRGVPASKSGKP